MLIYDAEYFDPEATLECGQIFRYKMLDKNDYILFSLDYKCRVYKRRDKVILESDNEEYFRNYFDLDTDYGAINSFLLGFEELKDVATKCKGIRILRQNMYECLMTFIISANNNIPRIKGIIQNLTRMFGEQRDDYHTFPSLKRLSEMTPNDFRELGVGFRDTYLSESARILSSTDFVEKINSSDNETAFRMLCSLPGVGPKVADCVMLFGLGRKDRFPVDVWMFRACKSELLDTPRKVNEFYTKRYGEFAGIAQQYIFHSIRKRRTNNPRKKLAKTY